MELVEASQTFANVSEIYQILRTQQDIYNIVDLKNTAKRAGKCKDQCRCSRKIGQRYPHLVWFAEASISQGAGQTLLKIHMKLIRE